MENLARCFVIVFCFSALEFFSGLKTASAHIKSVQKGFTSVFSLPDIHSVQKETHIIDFKASYNGSYTLLEWRSEKDREVGFYTVEVSHDEEHYEAIAEVKNFKSGQDFKSYVYMDHENLLKDSFYRLRHLEADGSFSYSPVVMVKVNPLNQLRLFPIPVKNILNIKGFFGSDELEIKITDFSGNSFQVYNLIKIANDHYTVDLSSFAPNTYFIKVSSNGKSASYRVLKL